MRVLRKALGHCRRALPPLIEALPGPGAASVAAACARIEARGMATTFSYFPCARDTDPDATADAMLAACALLGEMREPAGGPGRYVSLKAPPLDFDAARALSLAEAAAHAGMPVLFDAVTPAQAEATLALAGKLAERFPGTGAVLPARWRRSMADAAEWRDAPARLRIVKGEWADPEWPDCDAHEAFLALVGRLAGRTATVAVATHDPALAERALALLQAAGTPCELEQLRGLPRRRTTAVAQRMGVPVRLYLPFGPGWWSYAIDKAIDRPYLPAWWLRDILGAPDRAAPRPATA